MRGVGIRALWICGLVVLRYWIRRLISISSQLATIDRERIFLFLDLAAEVALTSDAVSPMATLSVASLNARICSRLILIGYMHAAVFPEPQTAPHI